MQYIHHEEYVKWTDDALVKRSEQLKDFFTPNGHNQEELEELLEIERELTLREE